MEPLQYLFMQKAFLAIIMAGVICACIGSYLVLRKMAFMAEALSHTLLPGIILSYLMHIQAFWGALFASLLTALGVSVLSDQKNIREDTAIGVILSAMFAIGIAMLGFISSFKDLSAILLGSILSITYMDLMLIGGCLVLIMVVLVLLHKELELSSFDPNYTELIGAKPKTLKTILLVLTAMSVVCAVKTIGTLLTTALLIIPAATACILVRTLLKIMLLASLIAIISGILGLYISFYYSIPSGAAIVLCTCLCFLLSHLYRFFLYKKKNFC